MPNLIELLGFGGAGLTAVPSTHHAHRLLGAAFDAGIMHFDTAPAYGQGYSEKILGDFLRPRRENVTLATKFGLGLPGYHRLPPWLALPLNHACRRLSGHRSPAGPIDGAPLLSPRRVLRSEIAASFDSSRRALRTEWIDLYLLHEGLPSFLEPAALDYLLDLRRNGTIRQLGVAAGARNYLGLAPDAFAGWDVLQYEYGPAWPAVFRELPSRFPAQQHIFHSCLRDFTRFPQPDVSTEDLPGMILRRCVQANPTGRVLCFSRHPGRLRRNLRALAHL